MFPAGEVSRMRPGGVRDGKWSDGFARIAMRAGVPVLPVHIAARNSVAFYGLSMLAKPLSTAMLPREATSGKQRVGFRIGKLVDPEELKQASGGSSETGGQADAPARVSRRTPARPRFRRATPLAHPEPVERVVAELDKAELLGGTPGRQAHPVVAGLR